MARAAVVAALVVSVAACGRESHAGRSASSAAAVTSTSATVGATLDPSRPGGSTLPDVVAGIAPGTWKPLADAPGRASGTPVWTGRDLIVWSGDDGRSGVVAEGAALDLSTGRWRDIGAGPLRPRASHSGVWTGTEVLYWGGISGLGSGELDADGAAYNPSTNTWRMLPPSPLRARAGHEAVWTGKQMIVWGGYTQCCPIDSTLHDTSAAAYEPVTNTWRRLADVPAPWSGDGGKAIVGRVGPDMVVWRQNRVGRFDPAANTWRDLGAAPAHESTCRLSSGPVARGTFIGDQLYVWTGGCRAEHGAAFDVRAGRWTDLGPAPEQLNAVTTVGDSIYGIVGASSASTRRFDPATRAWLAPTPAPEALGASPFVGGTGSALLVWGGFGADGPVRSGALLRPA